MEFCYYCGKVTNRKQNDKWVCDEHYVDVGEKIGKGLKEMALGLPKPTESQDIFAPLRKVVPEKWRDGFMFMGKYTYKVRDSKGQEWNIGEIHDYKHGITRRYLHITPVGNCYCNIGRNPEGKILLESCPCDKAMDIAYKNIEEFGATRETAYDAEYIEKRDKALAELGFVVLDVSPSEVTETRKGYRAKEEL